MILYFYSIILGIIQGLTEFLPISSSGHLILFHQFLSFDLADNLTFDAVLHLGSLLALIIFFRKDINSAISRSSGLLHFVRNDNVKVCHCEEPAGDESQIHAPSLQGGQQTDAAIPCLFCHCEEAGRPTRQSRFSFPHAVIARRPAGRRGNPDDNQKILFFILIATLPAAISGFFFESIIEKFFSSLINVSMALIIGGILFIVFEKISSQKDSLENLNFKSAMIIGFSQALALIPGVSRSGITIIAGLGRNLNREAAARFSFLLAMPIIFGAGMKKFFDLSFASLSFEQGMIFILGFLSAFISSYFCVKYFLKYLKNHSLIPFAVYRFILAGIIIIYIFK